MGQKNRKIASYKITGLYMGGIAQLGNAKRIEAFVMALEGLDQTW
jgi:hypothetical protein